MMVLDDTIVVLDCPSGKRFYSSYASLGTTLPTCGALRLRKLGDVAQPIRVAITGNTISPPLFESLELLGKERTMSRVRRAVAEIGG